MNNKVLFLVVILIIVFGAGIFFIGNRTDSQKTAQKSSPAQTIPTQKTSNSQVQEVIITFNGNEFSPQTLTVKAGTRVVWVNKSERLVNVSSDIHPTHLIYPALNLGNFPNNSSVQLVFDKPGTYKYHNHLSPSQTGTVIVE